MRVESGPKAAADVPGRITLVLGGGWKLGGSFHSGVVLALHHVWGIDARRVDAVIGTSSGAVIAGLLTAGMSPEDLFRRETAAPLSEAGRMLLARVESTAGHRARGQVAQSASRDRDGHIGLHTQSRSTGAALVALLPRGSRSMAPLEHYFDDLVGPDWPTETDLQLCAVELATGRRVALTRDSGLTVGQAVAASCAIPGVSEPVRIENREYVDGAIHSINNADLAVPTVDFASDDEADDRRNAVATDGVPRHTVIVSAPLSASRVQITPVPMALLRNAMRAQTRIELRKLHGAHQVVLMEPTLRDLYAMGSNLNANSRRRRVARRAYVTACEVLRSNELQFGWAEPAAAANSLAESHG